MGLRDITTTGVSSAGFNTSMCSLNEISAFESSSQCPLQQHIYCPSNATNNSTFVFYPKTKNFWYVVGEQASEAYDAVVQFFGFGNKKVSTSNTLHPLQNTWSNLSPGQIEHGVHPNALRSIQFDFNESELSSKDFLQQMHHFFVGCKMATSASDFLLKSRALLDSNVPQPIKTIIERVLLIQLPQESWLQPDHFLRFEGVGYGSSYSEYRAKFADAYNKLVKENMTYLMHPARRSELIEYLGITFSDTELTADRLIQYRCFGYYGLKISEYERALQEHTDALQVVQEKLSALSERGPHLITNLNELQKVAFSCIPNKYCRKHVYLAYKQLAAQNKLAFLDLPEKELYKYLGREKEVVHPHLAPFVEAYWNKTTLPSLHFGFVVQYLKQLRNNDLNALKQYCLNEEGERLKLLVSYQESSLEDAKINYQNQLGLQNKKPEDFKPGDFSFLTDPLTKRILTNGYNAVEKLKAWPFFDKEPPKGHYQFWRHPMIDKIGAELDSDDHSGVSMGFTLRWMQRIRKKGWEVEVRETLEVGVSKIGSLDRAYALPQTI